MLDANLHNHSQRTLTHTCPNYYYFDKIFDAPNMYSFIAVHLFIVSANQLSVLRQILIEM